MEYNITTVTVIHTMKYWQVKFCGESGDITVLMNVKEKTNSTLVIIFSNFHKYVITHINV